MSIEHQPASARAAALDSMLRLGQRLRSARLARNLTQAEVARNEFSISYISAVERGQLRPSLSALERLAARLQVPLSDLLSEDDLDVRSPIVSARHRDSASERHRAEFEKTLLEAQILLAQRKSDEALGLLFRLSGQHFTSRESAEFHLALATGYSDQGRAEEARRVAQDALPQAERAGERALACRLHAALGRALSQLHDHAAALEQYRAAEQAHKEQEIVDPALHTSLLLAIGSQFWSLTDYDQASTVLLQAVEGAEDVVRPERLASLYWDTSQTLAARGDRAGAKRYALQSLSAYQEAERRRTVTAAYTLLGMALVHAGQQEEAVTQLRNAEALAAGQQDLRGRAEAQRNLALVYLEKKRPADAEQVAREALDAAEQLGDTAVEADMLVVLARVLEVRQEPRDANQRYERALELLRSLPGSTAAEQLHKTYAQFSEYLERQGESQRAFEMLKEAYKSTL